MLRICFLLAFVMSAAMAFPQDEVLPETSATLSQLSENHPELKHATPKDAAHAKIKLMQDQGFDNTQCNQLATDAITGMTSALKAEQDTMTALSTGADCLVTTPATRRLLGIAAQQQLLDDAAAALVLAKADLATKETALATASSAPVSITMTLDTIGTNMAAIGQAVSLDSAVVSAKAAVVTAQAAKDAANLVVVADQASFDTAATAAQDASQECLCNAKAAHDTAWPNAQKVVTDNTQAWKEAHHVKCALDGTADDACSVPAFTVTDTVLVTEAANVVCIGYHKVFDGECGGAEFRKYYHAITNDANPGTTVAERVKYCAEACDGFNVPQDLNRRGLRGGTTGGVAKGFAVTPNEGVCWCEPQDSSTCARTMDPTRDAANTGYDRYDFR